MMYPYITLADETEITHSHIMDSDGVQIVEVHFERPVEKGFCSARCSLPEVERAFLCGGDSVFLLNSIRTYESKRYKRAASILFYVRGYVCTNK